MAAAALTRLQEFFRSLFQFDLADLDFGLYRLFRIEQAAIEGIFDVLINGDSATPGVASLDPLFKRLMMGEEGL